MPDNPSYLDNLLNAISGQESGGDPAAVNERTGAVGQFQVLPENIVAWGKEVTGRIVTPLQVLPENIVAWGKEVTGRIVTPREFYRNPVLAKQIVSTKLDQFYNQNLSISDTPLEAAERTALQWYTGKNDPDALKRNWSARNPSYPNEPSPKEYVANVTRRLRGGAPSQPATNGTSSFGASPIALPYPSPTTQEEIQANIAAVKSARENHPLLSRPTSNNPQPEQTTQADLALRALSAPSSSGAPSSDVSLPFDTTNVSLAPKPEPQVAVPPQNPAISTDTFNAPIRAALADMRNRQAREATRRGELEPGDVNFTEQGPVSPPSRSNDQSKYAVEYKTGPDSLKQQLTEDQYVKYRSRFDAISKLSGMGIEGKILAGMLPKNPNEADDFFAKFGLEGADALLASIPSTLKPEAFEVARKELHAGGFGDILATEAGRTTGMIAGVKGAGKIIGKLAGPLIARLGPAAESALSGVLYKSPSEAIQVAQGQKSPIEAAKDVAITAAQFGSIPKVAEFGGELGEAMSPESSADAAVISAAATAAGQTGVMAGGEYAESGKVSPETILTGLALSAPEVSRVIGAQNEEVPINEQAAADYTAAHQPEPNVRQAEVPPQQPLRTAPPPSFERPTGDVRGRIVRTNKGEAGEVVTSPDAEGKVRVAFDTPEGQRSLTRNIQKLTLFPQGAQKVGDNIVSIDLPRGSEVNQNADIPATQNLTEDIGHLEGGVTAILDGAKDSEAPIIASVKDPSNGRSLQDIVLFRTPSIADAKDIIRQNTSFDPDEVEFTVSTHDNVRNMIKDGLLQSPGEKKTEIGFGDQIHRVDEDGNITTPAPVQVVGVEKDHYKVRNPNGTFSYVEKNRSMPLYKFEEQPASGAPEGPATGSIAAQAELPLEGETSNANTGRVERGNNGRQSQGTLEVVQGNGQDRGHEAELGRTRIENNRGDRVQQSGETEFEFGSERPASNSEAPKTVEDRSAATIRKRALEVEPYNPRTAVLRYFAEGGKISSAEYDKNIMPEGSREYGEAARNGIHSVGGLSADRIGISLASERPEIFGINPTDNSPMFPDLRDEIFSVLGEHPTKLSMQRELAEDHPDSHREYQERDAHDKFVEEYGRAPNELAFMGGGPAAQTAEPSTASEAPAREFTEGQKVYTYKTVPKEQLRLRENERSAINDISERPNRFLTPLEAGAAGESLADRGIFIRHERGATQDETAQEFFNANRSRSAYQLNPDLERYLKNGDLDLSRVEGNAVPIGAPVVGKIVTKDVAARDANGKIRRDSAGNIVKESRQFINPKYGKLVEADIHTRALGEPHELTSQMTGEGGAGSSFVGLQLAREMGKNVEDFGLELGSARYRNLGLFSVKRENGEEVRLRFHPAIFADPNLAAGVVAHEAGHFVDYLTPENRTTERGNVLGHILAAKEGAMAEFGSLKDATLRNELTNLSRQWHPYETTSKKYLEYRTSPKELIADAIGAYLNNPELVNRLAPSFANNFSRMLDARPQVKEVFANFADAIKGDEHAIGKLYNDYQAFSLAKARTQLQLNIGERTRMIDESRGRETKDKKFRRGAFDPHFTVNQIGRDLVTQRWKEMREVLKKDPSSKELSSGQKISAALNEYAAHERAGSTNDLKYSENVKDAMAAYLGSVGPGGAEGLHYVNIAHNDFRGTDSKLLGMAEYDLFRGLVKPLTDAGMTLEDAHTLAAAQAEQGFRKGLPGADAFAARSSENLLRRQLGAQKFALLSDHVQGSRDLLASLSKEALESGVISPDQYKATLANQKSYSRYRSAEHTGLDITYSHYKGPEGFLTESDNVFVNNLQLAMAMKKEILRNNAVGATVKMLKSNFPDEIVAVEKGVKPPFGMDKIAAWENGKRSEYWVDRHLADTYKWAPLAERQALAHFAQLINVPLKGAIVHWNPIFQARHAVRNVEGMITVGGFKTLPAYIRNLKIAFDATGGKAQPGTREYDAVRNGTVRMYDRPIETPHGNANVQLMHQLGFETGRAPSTFDKAVTGTENFLNKTLGMRRIFQATEAAPRLAMLETLSKKGVDEQTSARIAKDWVSTPNTEVKGTAKWVHNGFGPFMFYDVHAQGLYRTYQMLRNPVYGSGYLARAVLTQMLPKVISYGLRMGVASHLASKALGSDDETAQALKHFETMYKYIPDDIMRRYMSVPYAYTKDSKGRPAVKTIEFPDELGEQPLSDIIAPFAKAAMGGTKSAPEFLADAGKSIAEQLPGVHPYTKAMALTGMYFLGENPVDWYYYRNILSDAQYGLAKQNKFDPEPLGALFSYIGNDIGGSLIRAATKFPETRFFGRTTRGGIEESERKVLDEAKAAGLRGQIARKKITKEGTTAIEKAHDTGVMTDKQYQAALRSNAVSPEQKKFNGIPDNVLRGMRDYFRTVDFSKSQAYQKEIDRRAAR